MVCVCLGQTDLVRARYQTFWKVLHCHCPAPAGTSQNHKIFTGNEVGKKNEHRKVTKMNNYAT